MVSDFIPRTDTAEPSEMINIPLEIRMRGVNDMGLQGREGDLVSDRKTSITESLPQKASRRVLGAIASQAIWIGVDQDRQPCIFQSRDRAVLVAEIRERQNYPVDRIAVLFQKPREFAALFGSFRQLHDAWASSSHHQHSIPKNPQA